MEVIIIAALTGKALLLISTPHASLPALLVIGIAMCMGGIGKVGASGRCTSPLAIIGYFLGAAILVIIISTFIGWKLPLISGETKAVAATGILIVMEFLISTISFFFHWL